MEMGIVSVYDIGNSGQSAKIHRFEPWSFVCCAGEGLVGNAFATSKLVFSHDVQNLTPIQYPFVTFARQHNPKP